MWFAAVSEQDENGENKDADDPSALAPAPLHFVSRRSPIYCTNGCVATSQPLATSIGLHILRGCGGNAADASVAVAAALAVVSFILLQIPHCDCLLCGAYYNYSKSKHHYIQMPY